MTIELTGRSILFEGKPVNGRYIAVAEANSVSGLSVSLLDGAAAHGNRFKVEAEASYAIGPKPEPEPKFWHMGGDFRKDGTAYTADAIGTDAGNGSALGATAEGIMNVVDSFLRHSNVDRHYLSLGRGNVSSVAWPSTTVEKGRKYYQAGWYWVGQTHGICRFFPGLNITGAFNTFSDRRLGEQVTVTNSDSSLTISGNITHVDASGEVTVSSNQWPDTSTERNKFWGGTVTGDVSGASLDIANNPEGLADLPRAISTKWGRPGTPTRNPGVYYTYGSAGDGQFFNGARDVNDNKLNPDSEHLSYPGGSPDNTPQQWYLIEWIIDLSSNNDDGGKVYLRSNGVTIYSYELSDTTAIRDVQEVIQMRNVGMESAGLTSTATGISTYWGELYADNDTRRIYLCDATTVASSTKWELQYPDSWTENADGSVVFEGEFYQGSLSSVSGSYLAVMENDTVKFEGLEVPA